MRSRGRGLRVAALVAGGALTLAACGSDDGGSDSGAEGASGGAYSVGFQTPEDLTPSNCYDLYCANINQGLFTGLFELETEGDTLKVVPSELLDSVTTEDDGKTYTITIKTGNSFTNGDPVTAQTFVDTWNFAASGGNGQQLGFVFGPAQLNIAGYDEVSDADTDDGEMAGLKAVDDTTIEIELEEPLGQPVVEAYLAGPQVLPMPAEAFEDIDEYRKAPIGNGPYKLQGSFETTGVTLVRNEDYNFEPGKADEIEFRFYSDQNALWADLQANNLDVSLNLPTSALSQAESVLGDRFINRPGLSMSYNVFPEQLDAFKERDVRVALAKAVDWDEINRTLYYETRERATAYAPPTVEGGGQDACGDDCAYDPEAAKALLEGAGGIPGDEVQVVGYANDENLLPKAQCNYIQESLGVACEVKIYESFGEALSAFKELSSDDEGLIIGLGWGADNPLMPSMFAGIFTTDSGSNYTEYSNADFDRLVAEGNQATDEADAISKWQEAEKVLYEDFPGHATQWRNQIGGYSTNVSNVAIDPAGYININEITVNSAG